ncbi:MAG: hypothetical protein E7005_06420 [Alphaproteobacteria bacterium]|nr:hypothetical protein [Alphaproteobacteria bacterium]
MKKIKKFLRFVIISCFMLAIFVYIGRFFFNMLWDFDIISLRSYAVLNSYWNEGGNFNDFKELSLLGCLILFPILWLRCSMKIYKKGFFKTLASLFSKSYRKLTRPKNMETEHVSIKNLGSKDRTLDEIISDKIKEKGGNIAQGKESTNLRHLISAKIEENEKQ